ncbi:asparagine synthase (glutamine-hydrolyzing) [Wolinella succinogenes]|uniref:asparagine synthase (glutamine-hydrolyzing) n=1 Tax=Wolinella succinogenes TaxID=844 RepID=UPI00240A06C6|nr:asparagine synthase (glutamine-hydrolyzing) [Wolinella succinogenes]
MFLAMCSICGGTILPSLIQKASDTMRHRGPDARGFWGDGKVSLAHNRLSILDLSEAGNQPFGDERYRLIFNGEIYNFQELSSEYGLRLQSSSDTEVLWRLLILEGEKILPRLNGMFSFLFYDGHKGEILMARDRFGKKPLFYFHEGKELGVASEIKALRAILGEKGALDQGALLDYLSYLAPCGEKSFFPTIHKLPAGCLARFSLSEGRLEKSSFYSLPSAPGRENIEEKEALRRIEELLVESVRYRLLSDVPVASFLSGGIDSSLISALYARLSLRSIETFSIGYDEYKHYDELPYAREVASHIGSIHHEKIATRKDFLEALEEVLPILDEPLGDPAIIPTYLLSKEVAKSGFKVVLSGEGSDEIFFGYDGYFDALKLLWLENSLGLKEKAILLDYHRKSEHGGKEWERLRRLLMDEKPYFRGINESWTPGQRARLFKQEPAWRDPILETFQDFSSKEGASWYSYIDLKHWMAEVLMSKMDRMSMAHSLESRAPFLDYQLVDFVLSLSSSLRTGETTKNLLKKIALAYLPDSIVNRRKKGFSSPMFEWYFEAYQGRILEDYRRVNRELGWFEDSYLKFLYEKGRMGEYKSQNWGMILFSRWFLIHCG